MSFVFRQETYSAYSSSGEYSVTLYASQMTEDMEEVKVTDVNAGELISTISVNKVPSSVGQYKLLNTLPSVKAFKIEGGNYIPTSRGYFQGNALGFSIANADFSVYNVWTWPAAATSELGAGDIYVAGNNSGVVVGTDQIQAFYCHGSNYPNFKCELDGNSQAITGLENTIFSMEATPNGLSDTGVVALTTSANGSAIHLFSQGGNYRTQSIAGFTATNENSSYQRVDSLYTLWTTDGTTKITIYVYLDANLTLGTNVEIDAASLSKGPKQFCPTSITPNPNNLEQTFVTSQCDDDDTRIITFDLIVADNKLTVEYNSSKVLRSSKLGKGKVRVCSLGEEHIIQKDEANDKAISTTDNTSDDTFLGLDVANNAPGANPTIYCIKNSSNFLITTDSEYAALFGNRAGNIESRYHSVIGLGGYTVQYAVANLNGYTVGLKNGDKWKFQNIIVNGPAIFYTGAETAGEVEVDLKITALGAEVDTQKLKIDISTFNPEVTVVDKEAGSEPVQGSQALDTLVTITGPVFNVKLDKGTSSADINLTSAIADDSSYTPVFTKNMVPPTRIKSDKNGDNIGFVKKAGENSVDIYLYKDYTTLDESFTVPNVELNSVQAIDCANTDEVAFGMFGTVNGGINQLTWFVRDREEAPGKIDQGVIAGVDFLATDVKIVHVTLAAAVGIAIDNINQTAIAFTFTLKKVDGSWTVEISNMYTFHDCKQTFYFIPSNFFSQHRRYVGIQGRSRVGLHY
jgi:hypothetical protein